MKYSDCSTRAQKTGYEAKQSRQGKNKTTPPLNQRRRRTPLELRPRPSLRFEGQPSSLRSNHSKDYDAGDDSYEQDTDGGRRKKVEQKRASQAIQVLPKSHLDDLSSIGSLTSVNLELDRSQDAVATMLLKSVYALRITHQRLREHLSTFQCMTYFVNRIGEKDPKASRAIRWEIENAFSESKVALKFSRREIGGSQALRSITLRPVDDIPGERASSCVVSNLSLSYSIR